jgi:Na+-transporting NADH:ubiquinone oxidoreductase subunit C
MNRNSNVYTVIYATVLTVLVAILLSAAALGLKDKQKANTDNEKKQQILMSVASKLGKEVTFDNAAALWNELNMNDNMFCINTKGEKVDGQTFEINAKTLFQAGKIKADATLPVYVANIDGTPYTIMSMYGAGLWGPIWGYLAVDPQGNVAGASFDHDSETAGLGAKIKDDPAFAAAFIGKNIFTNGKFTSVSVTKAGKPANYGGEKVDAITGATKTSDYVGAMIYESLLGYVPYLQSNASECGKCEQKTEDCNAAHPCTKEDCKTEACNKEACTTEICGKEDCSKKCIDEAPCDACKKAE